MGVGSKQAVVVEFKTKSVKSSISRPSDTTLYTAGDVISAITTDDHLTFSKAVNKGTLSGAIGTARIISSANQTTKPDLELWLFRVDPATRADNLAFNITQPEHDELIGIIDFAVGNWKVGNPAAGALGSASCEAQNIGLVFRGGLTTTTSDRNIYGQLVVRNGYTPVADEVFLVELVITQD